VSRQPREAAFSRSCVFHEAVTVQVTIFIYPAERRLDIGPNLSNGFHVAGVIKVHAGEHDE